MTKQQADKLKSIIKDWGAVTYAAGHLHGKGYTSGASSDQVMTRARTQWESVEAEIDSLVST